MESLVDEVVKDRNSSHNQRTETEEQVEQVTRGGCFRSICFFLLDEQQVVCEASRTAVGVRKVDYLTRGEGKQEAMKQF